MKQDGHLRVRQREQLRRALSASAEFLDWAIVLEDQEDVAIKDVLKLTRRGTRTLNKELADEVASKKAEISELQKTASSLEKLAEKDDFSDPIEVSYSHTAGRAPETLTTKVQTVTLTDAQGATDAANAIVKKLESWGKLRDQMLIELKNRQRQLDEMVSIVPPFVESSRQLLSEVLATIH